MHVVIFVSETSGNPRTVPGTQEPRRTIASARCLRHPSMLGSVRHIHLIKCSKHSACLSSFETLLGSSWTPFWEVVHALSHDFSIIFLLNFVRWKFQIELAGWCLIDSSAFNFSPFLVFQSLVRPFKSGQVLKAFPDGQARPGGPDTRPKRFGPP